MGYELSQDAKTDLARIYWRGVDQFGVRKAERYVSALYQRFDEIADSPFRYQAVDYIRTGYRRSVCGVDSIYFRLEGSTVQIMRILGRQDIQNTLA